MIYFDNAATTRVCPEAAQAALEVMTRDFGNPSSRYALGAAASERLASDRAVVAQALGWTGDNLQEVAPGCSLGGDVFTDVENLTFRNLKYRSCDVDVEAQESRSQTQLVYVEDLSYIYYTEDGGESFRLLYRAT